MGALGYSHFDHLPMKIARLYLRVSTNEQDLTRQAQIEQSTRSAGYYIAGVYREKASGARLDRPELQWMIADLQPGEVVIAEKIDRLSRLPLPEAEQLVNAIRAQGARLAIPGLVDLSDLATAADGVTKIVLESVQELLLKLALQMTRDDYETRRARQRSQFRPLRFLSSSQHDCLFDELARILNAQVPESLLCLRSVAS